MLLQTRKTIAVSTHYPFVFEEYFVATLRKLKARHFFGRTLDSRQFFSLQARYAGIVAYTG